MLEFTCRICASQQNNLIYLLSEDGERLNLTKKIRKYLNVTISPGDKLPKKICVHCCKKVNAIHKFATMALNVQTQFINTLNNDKTQSEEKNSTDIQGLDLIDNENDVTEMEVRIDPLLYLECLSGEDLFQSDLSDKSSDVSDSPPSSPQNVSSIHEELDAEISDSSNLIKEPIKLTLTDRMQVKKTYYMDDITITPSIKKSQYVEDSEKNLTCTIYDDKHFNDIELKTHLWNHLLNGNRRTLTISDSDSIEKNEPNVDLYDKDEDITFGDSSSMVSCPVCGKQISTKGNLKVHLETHKPKGRYECDKCGRIFKTEANLFRHKEYHGGVQFRCDVCGRVYPTNSTLRAHSITHSDLRPHKCPICDKTFKRNQDLKFHINQHTGARPYQCLYCPKAFASSGNCFSHRKRMHPQELERDRERADQIYQ